jgi:hypothetical protein
MRLGWRPVNGPEAKEAVPLLIAALNDDNPPRELISWDSLRKDALVVLHWSKVNKVNKTPFPPEGFREARKFSVGYSLGPSRRAAGGSVFG